MDFDNHDDQLTQAEEEEEQEEPLDPNLVTEMVLPNSAVHLNTEDNYSCAEYRKFIREYAVNVLQIQDPIISLISGDEIKLQPRFEVYAEDLDDWWHLIKLNLKNYFDRNGDELMQAKKDFENAAATVSRIHKFQVEKIQEETLTQAQTIPEG